MRLFVAVELPPSLVATADSVGRLLRERISQIAPRARLTWVATDHMHVTIRFIGEVDGEKATAIGDVLGAALEAPPFTMALGHIGAFPRSGAPRALWLGLTTEPESLAFLEQEVSARLARVGVPREPRPFSAHLTLARVREPAGLRASAVVEGLAASPHAGARIDAITLFASRLSPQGPTYTALRRTSLHGR